MLADMVLTNIVAVPMGVAVNWANGGLGWMLDNPPGALLAVALAEVLLWLILAMAESARIDGSGGAT